MAIVGNAPATLDLVVRQGSDFALTLTVELDGDPYDFTGATVTAKMINAAGAEQTSVAWTPTTSTGELVLTLDETATALIQSGWRYYVDVTKASITQPWVAGALSPVALGRGGRSSSTATLSITTDTGATLTISADPGQGVAAHLADTSDAHDASAISFAPSGTIAGTDVQTAVAEVASDAAAALAAHVDDTSDAHDASAISLLDTGGHWTATTVEGALAEVPSRYAPSTVIDAALGNGTTDAASAIQAAIDAVNTAGGGIVYLPAGDYKVSSTVVMKSHVRLVGAGETTTTIIAASGLNDDVLQGYDFDALTTTSSSGGIEHFGIEHLTVDGNRANNSSGWCFRFFGKAYTFSHCRFQEGKSGAVWSEWGSSGGVDMEGRWDHVTARNSEGNVIEWRGPHDTQFVNCLVYNDGSQSDTSGTLFYHSSSNSGFIQATNCHFWGNCTRAVDISASSIFTGCLAEGATTAQVRFRSNFSQWIGGSIFRCNTAAGVGLELGEAGVSSAKGCLVITRFTDIVSGAYPIKFANTAGNNTIVAHFGANTSTVTALYTGTPNTTAGTEDRIDARWPEATSLADSWQVDKVNSSRVIIPCTQLAATSGSPAIGNLSSTAVMLFDASATEIASTQIMLPPWWKTAKVWFHWAGTGAGSGDVKWTFRYAALDSGSTVATSTNMFRNAMTAGSAGIVVQQSQDGSLTNTSGKLLTVRVERDATNVADTYTTDAALIAIEFVRLT